MRLIVLGLLFFIILFLVACSPSGEALVGKGYADLTNQQKQAFWQCQTESCKPLFDEAQKTKDFAAYRSCSLDCYDLATEATKQVWCTDSDGDNYVTKGIVKTNIYPKGKEDSCYTFPNGKTYLFEGQCVNKEYQYIQKNCAELGQDYFCDKAAGICVPKATASGEAVPTPLVVNVKDFGAIGDGNTDDGKAFQNALDFIAGKGSGKLYLPAGNYFIDQTLLIYNHTEIYGEGDKTILFRGDKKSNVPWYGGLANCEKNIGFAGRVLFWNAKYNCGNKKIYLHDFMIDGSKVLTVPGSVTLAFSAVEDLTIENIHLLNAPQDGIFVRNGGVHTTLRNNVIDGFCTRWYNGGGINIEMHTKEGDSGNFPTPLGDQAIIDGNTIIARGQNFCKEDGITACSSNAQCTTTCGADAAVGILATWINGEFAPRVSMSNNHIKVTDKHVGIGCHGCRDSVIDGNTISSYESGTAWSGLFTGIITEYPWPNGGPGWNLTVINNIIQGNGKPFDGRGILLSSNSPESKWLVVSKNTISNKNIVSNLAALEVRGYSNFEITDNIITKIGNVPALVVGICDKNWKTTTMGNIEGNVITLTNDNPSYPFILRKVADISIGDNQFTPSSAPKTIC